MIHSMTGAHFAHALRAGTMAVLQQEALLNRINVFPVPDGDTGCNLAATLCAAAARLDEGPAPAAVGAAAQVAAEAALDGARGNSGAIFAQFLAGFAAAVRGLEQLGPGDFTRASSAGSAAAYRAVHQPREGTILSVLRAWAESLAEQVEPAAGLAELVARSLPRAREALARTPEQLRVLARAGVVDAGGQGFVTFIEGMSGYLVDGTAPDWHPPIAAAAAPPATFEDSSAHAEYSSEYRYCTEALIAGAGLDRQGLNAAVVELGDSLVVAGIGELFRVHIHTNRPRRFFEVAATHGELRRCKIDDMWLQHPPARGAVALVTDSTCDLPEATAAELAAYTAPLYVAIGQMRFRDGQDLPPAAFYQRLRRSGEMPKTSQPSVGDMTALYARLLERHARIISVHIAEPLSGTVASARAAAARVDPERIHVIDSRQVSCGLGFVVEAVGRSLQAGEPVDAAVAAAERTAAGVRVFGTLPSLEHAVRGGRLDSRVARILDGLGLKPIVAFDAMGKVHPSGARLGFDRALRALAELAARFAHGAPARVRVVHADAPEAGARLAAAVRTRLGLAAVPVLPAGAVLGTHVGPGAVALAVCREPT